MTKQCPVCDATYAGTVTFCAADGAALRHVDTHGDLVGCVVDNRYMVTGRLGEGGMGTVYRARHLRLPQQAAIKVLRRGMIEDPAALARFKREAANASRIDHDRVARVFDFGETDDGVFYLAMELVQGETVKTLLAEDGAMPPARVARLIRQTAEGLDAAHRLGIVHRDLKPDNVMVIADADGTERVKVVDFGIAKGFGETADESRVTETGLVIGTPKFMSPEQLLGDPVDVRSDVYALALLAFDCLTGELPFPTETPDHGIMARLTSEARRLADVEPAVPWPAALQAVFDRGLARTPSQRPASAGAFASALGAAVDEWLAGAGARRDTPVATPTIVPTEAPVEVPAEIEMPAPDAVPAPRDRRRRTAIGFGAALAAAALLLVGEHLIRASPAARPAAAPDGPAVAPSPVAPSPVAPSSVTPSPIAPPAARPHVASVPDSTPVLPRRRVPLGSPPTPRVEPAAAAGGTSAHRAMDSITTILNAPSADATVARGALAGLRALLPHLTTPDDSAWTAAGLARAHALLEEDDAACTVLDGARTLAAREGAQAYLRLLHDGLGCR